MRFIVNLKNGQSIVFHPEHSQALIETGEYKSFIEDKLEQPNKDIVFTDNNTGEQVKTNYSEIIGFEVNFE